MNGKKALLLILAVILLDQALKIYIKTHFHLGQSYHVTDWFQILFVENRGMAFGIEPKGGATGKFILTTLRIVAVAAIGYWLYVALKQRQTLLALSLSLIFAGALGNIIDSVFYAKIFSDSFHEPARLFPPEGGYGDWFQGKVVDMFYFPLFDIRFPRWLPILGGKEYTFFNAIFNLADASITIGVLIMILFYKRIFKE
ncbi:MAG: lipoprotein signal peptidase [Chlorobi bacterium]|nr:lipoprotein signal peptidase [Chlorobiota bacterium]